jgi:hypothetical protein
MFQHDIYFRSSECSITGKVPGLVYFVEGSNSTAMNKHDDVGLGGRFARTYIGQA